MLFDSQESPDNQNIARAQSKYRSRKTKHKPSAVGTEVEQFFR